MAAVQYVAATSFTAGNGTSISGVAKPTGTIRGSCIVATLYIEDPAALGGTYTPASTGDTWVHVGTVTNTGATPDFDLAVWYCIVSNPTSTIGVTWNGTSTWRDFAVGTFSGVDPNNPLASNVTTNTGNSTTETGLDITTTEKYAHIVMASGNFSGNTRASWSSDLTERNDSGNVAFASGEQAAAGASGNKTNTITSDQWATVMFALRPALGAITFIGFESGNANEMFSWVGTNSIQSSVARTGTYALRVNPTAANGGGVITDIVNGLHANFGQVSVRPLYVTAYIRFASLPAANSEILSFINTISSPLAQVKCDSSGNITLVGTSTSGTIATVTTGQWYRFDFRAHTNSTCGLSVDGGTETTVTGNNVLAQRLILGTLASATMDLYYDDVVVSDLDFVDTPEVKIALPIGAGNYSSFTDGSGSTYAEVDEVPHDSSTTYIQNTSGTNVAHTFDMQSAATVGVQGDILALKPIAIMQETTSTSTLGGVRLRSGSTDMDHVAVDLGNTTYVPLQQILTLDPADWGAWDSTAFDAVEVGPFKGNDSSTIRATAVYLMVLSNGGAAPTDATIAGAAATATAAGVAGTVAAVRIAGVVGAVATSTSAGVAGSVVAVRNATISGATATATATAAGVAGSVAAVRIVGISGETATATAAGNAGAISSAVNASVSGETATATASGQAGTVAAVRIVSVSGVTGTATAAGNAGTVSTVRIANVAGETATGTSSGLAGSVAAVRIVTIAGEEATGTAAGLAGSLSGGVAATISGEPAAASGAGQAGTLAAVRVATVAGETGTASSAGSAGTVSTVRIATVQGETATSTAAGHEGVVTAVRVVTIAGEEATATAAGLAGSLSGGVSTSISGATATATASGQAGTLATVRVVSISGATGAADAAGVAGTLAAVRIAGISGTTATATSVGLAGAVAAQRVTTVAGETATATALGSAGSVTGIRIVTISGATATATAAGVAGAVSTGVFADNDVLITVYGSDTATMTVSGNEAGIVVDGTDTARVTITGGV